MKINDYAPRTGALEAYLTGKNLIGVEVGVDVGSHAESILTHCDIEKLYLVDIWENPYCEGYCEGRLARWRNKIKMLKGKSNTEVRIFNDDGFDFVYLDVQHDYVSVREDLKLWWPKVKRHGLMALRNYSIDDVKRAADEFMNPFSIDPYTNEVIFFKTR